MIDETETRALGVDAVLAGVARKTIHDYSSALFAAREKAHAEGREQDAQARLSGLRVVVNASRHPPSLD